MGLFQRIFGKRVSGKTLQQLEREVDNHLREAARKRKGGK